MYGWVTYTFKSNFVQVDYQSWMSDNQVFGSSTPPFPVQQMPISFLVQMTEISTDQQSLARNPGDSFDFDHAEISEQIGTGVGRWFMAQAIDNRPNDPIITPGNFLTLG
jgi:hypothetical protein